MQSESDSGPIWRLIEWLAGSGPGGRRGFLVARWVFLRLLGLWCFSAFYSLAFQIDGLIGPSGILPAGDYLRRVAIALGGERLWFAPTLLWFSAGSPVLLALCWVGMVAAVLLIVNVWPRLQLVLCFVCYVSFVAAAQDFAGYQSDGMLLEAIFISIFFAPRGWWPGLGAVHPPSRASVWLLRWEWFRIYFESGMVKLLSGDPEWRHLTAMNDYYQNGPLPTWIGWYIQHLPLSFARATALGTLVMELGVVLLLFAPRRYRLLCFLIVTPWEVGVIVTANYTFLNYLVLSLGVLLLDDGHWNWMLHACHLGKRLRRPLHLAESQSEISTEQHMHSALAGSRLQRLRAAIPAAVLGLLFYTTATEMVAMVLPLPILLGPSHMLEPFRIANQYGLFAVMTRGRYEIEFQGSDDGQHWTAYPFRYKPQALNQAPGIYAPYQPRFDWNLWFASLGDWRDYPIVPATEERLLEGSPAVLHLFARDPFAGHPPQFVRAVLWQYWFTGTEEKHRTGNWWRRAWMGVYAPILHRDSTGGLTIVGRPDQLPEHN